MIDAALLALLRCPLTMQPLRIASPELLAHLPVPLDAGLVREDGAVVYPIRDGIPVLLPGEAIPVGRSEQRSEVRNQKSERNDAHSSSSDL